MEWWNQCWWPPTCSDGIISSKAAGVSSLSVELPFEGFCYTHFSDALTALAHYADDYRGRVDDAVAADAAEIV